MKKQEALEIFRRDLLPRLDPSDRVALRCAWNDYVDALQKDRHISPHQAETWLNPYDNDQTKRKPRSAYRRTMSPNDLTGKTPLGTPVTTNPVPTTVTTDIILLRGLPGSGKSTYARRFWDKKYIVSADDFFTNAEGVYVFDRTKIGEAHESCWRRFYRLLNLDAPPPCIIVDNTNISAQEMTPYTMAARALLGDKARITVLSFRCSPEVALNRQVHAVPAFVMGTMHQRMLTAETLFGISYVGLQPGPDGEYPPPCQLGLDLAVAAR